MSKFPLVQSSKVERRSNASRRVVLREISQYRYRGHSKDGETDTHTLVDTKHINLVIVSNSVVWSEIVLKKMKNKMKRSDFG